MLLAEKKLVPDFGIFRFVGSSKVIVCAVKIFRFVWNRGLMLVKCGVTKIVF